MAARNPIIHRDPLTTAASAWTSLRQAFIDGAEEHSRQQLGRGLTVEELERALRRIRSTLGIG